MGAHNKIDYFAALKDEFLVLEVDVLEETAYDEGEEHADHAPHYVIHLHLLSANKFFNFSLGFWGGHYTNTSKPSSVIVWLLVMLEPSISAPIAPVACFSLSWPVDFPSELP